MGAREVSGADPTPEKCFPPITNKIMMDTWSATPKYTAPSCVYRMKYLFCSRHIMYEVCFCGQEKISELRLDSFPIPNQAMHLQAYVVPHHPFQSSANVQHDLHLKSIKYHAFSDEETFAMTQEESHTTHGWTIFIILLTVVMFACGIYSISTANKDIPAGYINLAQGEYQRDF